MSINSRIDTYFKTRSAYVPNRFWANLKSTNGLNTFIKIDPENLKSIDFTYPKPVIAEDIYTDTNSLHKMPYIKSVENSSSCSMVIQETSQLQYRNSIYNTLLSYFEANNYERAGSYDGLIIEVFELFGDSKNVKVTKFNAIISNVSEIKLFVSSKEFMEYTISWTIVYPRKIEQSFIPYADIDL